MVEGILVARENEISGLTDIIEIGHFGETFSTLAKPARNFAYKQLSKECKKLDGNIACIEEEKFYADSRKYYAAGKFYRFPNQKEGRL